MSDSPFTHVNEIYKKSGEFKGDGGYAQYIINKELSKNGHIISLVNVAQQYKLSNEIHFKLFNDFAPHSKRPGFGKFPWIWKNKKNANQEEIEVIAKHYNESISNAEDYYEILVQTAEGTKHIKWLRMVYGLENK